MWLVTETSLANLVGSLVEIQYVGQKYLLKYLNVNTNMNKCNDIQNKLQHLYVTFTFVPHGWSGTSDCW